MRIGKQFDLRSGLFRDLPCIGYDLRIRTITFWRGNPDRRAKTGATEQERMRYVVAIPHVCQRDVLEITKPFLQSEVISQRLAWMLQIAQRIDNRHRSVMCHAVDGFLRKGPQHDYINPAFEIVGDIAQSFAGIQSTL